jgi:hypothetical protein
MLKRQELISSLKSRIAKSSFPVGLRIVDSVIIESRYQVEYEYKYMTAMLKTLPPELHRCRTSSGTARAARSMPRCLAGTRLRQQTLATICAISQETAHR